MQLCLDSQVLMWPGVARAFFLNRSQKSTFAHKTSQVLKVGDAKNFADAIVRQLKSVCEQPLVGWGTASVVAFFPGRPRKV